MSTAADDAVTVTPDNGTAVAEIAITTADGDLTVFTATVEEAADTPLGAYQEQHAGREEGVLHRTGSPNRPPKNF